METTLVTAGIAFVAAAIIGGGLKAFQIEIPVIDTLARQILLGGFGLALIFIGAYGLDSSGMADPGADRSSGVVQPENSGSSTGEAGGESTSSGSSAASLDGCVVTIENSLVSLKPEPDPMSQGTAKVPPGDYRVEEYATTRHASTEMGFFRITVDERTGWIANDTWTIEDKTSSCP